VADTGCVLRACLCNDGSDLEGQTDRNLGDCKAGPLTVSMPEFSRGHVVNAGGLDDLWPGYYAIEVSA